MMKNTITRALTVLLFVIAFPLTACSATSSDDDTPKDLVEVAVEGGFETLATALQAAGLVDVLKGDGPFTVFAPTDEAFAKLPAGTLESLLRPENRDQLVAILTYHVVPGRVTSDQVVTLQSAETVQGAPLQISTQNGNVRVSGATVTAVDIAASNGVIHVIDTVLLPPSGN